MRLMQ